MQPNNLDIELSVSQFVGLLNQTLEYAYPNLVVVGELSNYRVNKNRWVYFDLKDETATVKFFGTVYQLPGPLEDGLILKVRGQPRLHNLYGFSVNVLSIQPAGEGSLRRAADLLRANLKAEGLFDEDRKRSLPYPPSRIGLITSKQSAAYADFIKIISSRWQGIEIELIDVQVQGEAAIAQIADALKSFNSQAEPPEALILIRGGGSAEDLAVFNTESVTRAVAASRVPTIVAIGHEIDTSLAELAADRRASTPSNAAELLVPDRREVLQNLETTAVQLNKLSERHIVQATNETKEQAFKLEQVSKQTIKQSIVLVEGYKQLLRALDPKSILRRGYGIVRHNGVAVRSINLLKERQSVDVQLADGRFMANVKTIKKGKYV